MSDSGGCFGCLLSLLLFAALAFAARVAAGAITSFWPVRVLLSSFFFLLGGLVVGFLAALPARRRRARREDD